MIIYYILSILATVALIVYAPEHLLFNAGSLCVIFVIAMMFFMAHHFKNNNANNESDTARDQLYKLWSLSFRIYIPLCLPFFFFLIEWKKIAAVCTLWFAAFLTGPIIYRIKYGKMNNEQSNNKKKG